MQVSKNEIISYILDRSSKSSIGILGKKRIFLRNKSCLQNTAETTDVSARVSQIKDLLLTRDGLGSVDCLSLKDVNEMIDYICTY